jgi:hypothetical protein
MTKTLNQFVEEGYLKVKSSDEQKFIDKHVAVANPDRNGNGDDVFKGAKVKKIDRRKERKGYDAGDDAKVYEEVEQIDELKHATIASYVKKRSDQLSTDRAQQAYSNAHRRAGGGEPDIPERSNFTLKQQINRGKSVRTALDKLGHTAKVSANEEADISEKAQRQSLFLLGYYF